MADSLSLRSFLDLDVTEPSPDHSTLSRTRRLIDVETHEAVFTWVLERLAEAGLVTGKTVGIDATTLEANAAMRSIERRDTGESHEAFIRRLAEASGVETPTRADLARFDRSRKNKKTSNKEWKSPQDPDAKIAKMKDGRTHLAHKAEHGVDMDTGAIVSVTVQDASDGDTATLPETLIMAAEQVELVQLLLWFTSGASVPTSPWLLDMTRSAQPSRSTSYTSGSASPASPSSSMSPDVAVDPQHGADRLGAHPRQA